MGWASRVSFQCAQEGQNSTQAAPSTATDSQGSRSVSSSTAGGSFHSSPSIHHKQSQPKASLNFPVVARQDRGVDSRNAGRMNGSFCADPCEERSKILQSLAWSSAQYLPVSLPSCSQNCPTTACFYTAGIITRVFHCRSSCPLIYTSEMVRYH